MKDNEVKEYEEYVKRSKERETFLIIVSIIIWGIVYFLGEESSIGSILLGIWFLLVSREIRQDNEDEKKWVRYNFLGKFIYDFLLVTIFKIGGIFLILRGVYLLFL